MPPYDPQRSRSRRRVADEDGPAPVDALLGPLPEPAASEGAARTSDPAPADDPVAGAGVEDAGPAPVRADPLIVDIDDPAPADAGGGRGRALVLAVVIAILAVPVAVLVWRRRRQAARP